MQTRFFYFSKFETFLIITLFLALTSLTITHRSSILRDNDGFKVQKKIVLYVEKSQSLEETFHELSELGANFNKNHAFWVGKVEGWSKVKRGHYVWDAGTYSLQSVLNTLGLGLQTPVKVTIIPGSTLVKIAQKIADSFPFSESQVLEVLVDSSFLAQNNVSEASILGYLHPETYSFYWTSSPKTIVNGVISQFRTQVEKPNAQRLLDLDYSMDQILTLASIIEWEAGNDEEKAKISGLYWNRLWKKWRLQADPTVNFAIGERRRLTFDDYEVDHPYNTYMIRGLPPGPINNPSKASIQAALYPEDHSYMYMVATPEGTHDFSKTYDDHQRKSKRWTEWLRKQRRIKRQLEERSR